jgi:hypothetical protein
MDIQSTKIELVKLIVNIDDQKVIKKLLHVLKSGQKDFWLDLSDNERKEIELGIKQLDAGNRISLDDFLKKFPNRMNTYL